MSASPAAQAALVPVAVEPLFGKRGADDPVPADSETVDPPSSASSTESDDGELKEASPAGAEEVEEAGDPSVLLGRAAPGVPDAPGEGDPAAVSIDADGLGLTESSQGPRGTGAVARSGSAEAEAPPARGDLEMLRGVPPQGPFPDARVAALVRKARRLAEEAFDEDSLQEVTKKSGWKLSLLADRDLEVLCGFVISKIKDGALSIYKIAVPLAFRGHGFGRYIMDEHMKAAKKVPGVYDVCLSSLPAAVAFYKRLGFKAFENVRIRSDEEMVEGQVYMEKKLRARPRRK